MRRIGTVVATSLAAVTLAALGVAPVAHAAADQVCALNVRPAPAKSAGLAPQPDPLACSTTGVQRQVAVGTVTIGI